MKTTNYIYTIEAANGREIVIERPYNDVARVNETNPGTVVSIREISREVVDYD